MVHGSRREAKRDPDSPWLNVAEACAYARVGRKVLYAAIAARRLRAAHVDGRRKIVVRREWIDAWLIATADAAEPKELR